VHLDLLVGVAGDVAVVVGGGVVVVGVDVGVVGAVGVVVLLLFLV